ncbi:inverse autotransporter beta domain-containing protein [Sodalis sp. RH21]|uniref:inverse autotransporter beta domain-containing protein n=1 Tax=unclassified Sodalis (in: enterobacteria) TaxID=2636512 RepID=UPI0039B49C06
MISVRYCVVLASITILSVGCFSTDKKKDLKKNKVNHATARDENVPDQTGSPGAKTSDKAAEAINASAGKNLGMGVTPVNVFATSNINFPLGGKGFYGTSFDILLPLKNEDSNLIFGQLGMRKQDQRNIMNLGLGQRHFLDNWMFGYNAFFDAQIAGNNHQRGGIGLELGGNNVKFSANGYHRLSGWKSSSLLKGQDERVANGFDIMAEGYLPSYPLLGAKVKYERYFGGDVATLRRNVRHANPSALTLGVNYTPIPLVTLGVDHAQWSFGKSEAKVNFGVNYQFNVPLARQLNPQFAPAARTLEGRRFDKVERNNNIVFDYRAKEAIHFRLSPALTGYEGERKYINFAFTAKTGLGRIEWDDSSLLPRGGKIIALSDRAYQVQLPKYDRSGSNRFVVSAVAYDKQGSASNRSEMTITIDSYQVMSSIEAGDAADKMSDLEVLLKELLQRKNLQQLDAEPKRDDEFGQDDKVAQDEQVQPDEMSTLSEEVQQGGTSEQGEQQPVNELDDRTPDTGHSPMPSAVDVPLPPPPPPSGSLRSYNDGSVSRPGSSGVSSQQINKPAGTQSFCTPEELQNTLKRLKPVKPQKVEDQKPLTGTTQADVLKRAYDKMLRNTNVESSSSGYRSDNSKLSDDKSDKKSDEETMRERRKLVNDDSDESDW